MKKGAIAGLIVVAVLIVLGLSFYGSINSTRDTGIALEQQLGAEYEDNQNYLSAHVSKIYELVGVANLKSAKLDTILTHAIEGRYGEDGFKAGGAFFAAVQEAYPDLTQLNIYDRIADQVSAGREGFRGKQSKLIDELRTYQTWQQQGLLRSQVVRLLGFPSQKLEARLGGKVVARGQEALDRMHTIVLTGSTTDAFTSGTMEPMKIQ